MTTALTSKAAPYDRIGVGYDTTRRADPYLASRLLALLNVAPSAPCLDVACGSGNYTLALANAGLRMTGVDLSQHMISQARQKAPQLPWHLGDAAALPFADGSFAGATCTLAIHHFADRRAAFCEIHRVLRAGRLVILTSSHEQIRGYWLNHYFPKALELSLHQMPDLPEVSDLLQAAGFSSISTEAYAVRPDLKDFFLQSGKHRPEIYLDPRVRAGISTFALFAEPTEVDIGCRRLADDIASGRISEVIASYQNPHGDYLFMVAGRDGHGEATAG